MATGKKSAPLLTGLPTTSSRRAALQEVPRVVRVDEDLAHRVVNARVRTTLADTELQEGSQQAQAVAFLDFVAERVDWQE
jgi:hypothetical protein